MHTVGLGLLGDSCRIGPFPAAEFAVPGVHRVDAREERVGCAAGGTGGDDELRDGLPGFVDDILRDGAGGNGAGFIELIGGDEDAVIDEALRIRALSPALNAGAAQHLTELPGLLSGLALTQLRLPCVVVWLAVFLFFRRARTFESFLVRGPECGRH